MEELISECIKYIDDEIGAHIASAFFLHFNANVFTLVSACPNDFRREIQVNDECYYWCDELFLTVRKHRIDDYFNRCASSIVKLCFNEGISTVVIGYNKDMKQSINIGSVNNQNFVCVPFHKLRSKLSYKCELHGIKVEFQEESYTSKASALDLDDVPSFDASGKAEHTFSGKRVKRGLYRSSDGTYINADINDSINILRKYIKERKLNGLTSYNVRAIVNSPCKRYNLFRSPSL